MQPAWSFFEATGGPADRRRGGVGAHATSLVIFRATPARRRFPASPTTANRLIRAPSSASISSPFTSTVRPARSSPVALTCSGVVNDARSNERSNGLCAEEIGHADEGELPLARRCVLASSTWTLLNTPARVTAGSAARASHHSGSPARAPRSRPSARFRPPVFAACAASRWPSAGTGAAWTATTATRTGILQQETCLDLPTRCARPGRKPPYAVSSSRPGPHRSPTPGARDKAAAPSAPPGRISPISTRAPRDN